MLVVTLYDSTIEVILDDDAFASGPIADDSGIYQPRATAIVAIFGENKINKQNLNSGRKGEFSPLAAMQLPTGS
jgi:hypothetical protein